VHVIPFAILAYLKTCEFGKKAMEKIKMFKVAFVKQKIEKHNRLGSSPRSKVV
jgi:hypothetical protein